MSRWDKIKVVVLILLPINTWLGMFYYLQRQQQRAWREALEIPMRESVVVHQHYQERLGIKIGQSLRYPFPYPVTLIGPHPPIGQGIPVLFVNISWIATSEVWRPAIKEARKISPYLHIVLLYYRPEGSQDLKPLLEMLQDLADPRLSVVVGGDWMNLAFGTERNGTLLILCDGKGIVRAVEPYPQLKISPYWEEEVADWRRKLHQAVKRVLDKFFKQKGEGAK